MGAIFSIMLTVGEASQTITMQCYHHALLPTPAIVLIQMIIGSALRSVPSAKIVPGPLAVAAFLYAFIDRVEEDSKVLSL